MPNTQTPIEITTPQPTSPPITTTDMQLAVLNERVSTVIGNHEKRISDLENRGKNWPTVMAAIAGVCVLVVSIAGRLPWQ